MPRPAVHSRGVDPDEHLARSRDGSRHLVDAQRVEPVPVLHDCSHDLLPYIVSLTAVALERSLTA